MLKKIKFRFPEFGWVLALFFVLFFLLQLKNNRFEMNDFKVYYLGMQNLLNGDSIYRIPFGLDSGFYKYSPFALLPFVIFHYLPFLYAAIIYYFIIATAILFVLYKLFQLFNQVFSFNISKKSTILYLCTLILLNHFYRELHLGNVNLLLLLLYIISLEKVFKNSRIFAGVLMGIGLLFKLHFIVLLPVLLLFKKFKTSFSMLITFLTGLFLPALFLGFNANMSLLDAWFVTMEGHNSSISTSADTVYAWINRILSIGGMQQQGILFSLVILCILGIVFLGIIYKTKQSSSLDSDKKRFTFIYFLAIAVIPIITVTDSEHFLFSLPIVMLSLFLVFSLQSMSIIWKSILIIAFIFYGGNWHDLWGHQISVFFTRNGFLGLGNMLLISFVVWAFLKPKKIQSKTE
ncbi:MAG: glycosyltransferase family 87 protein [Bacteroidales bacterium]